MGLLNDRGAESLTSLAFWGDFAAARGLRVIGPALHHYLDVDPGPREEIRRIDVADLERLRHDVPDDEWEESGFGDAESPNDVAFGVVDQDRLVVAAILTDFAGSARDVGVLVAPDARGRGLATRVGAQAASYAIANSGLARWRARVTNDASLAVATRLGFEPWCAQLAVR